MSRFLFLLGLLLSVTLPSQGADVLSEKSFLFSQSEKLYRSGIEDLNEESDPQHLKNAFVLLKQAADLGHDAAENYVGYFYERGLGIQRDPYWASVYYKKSAAQGNAQAQNNLGVLYERGRGVSQHYQEAARLYALSEAQGNIAARLNLAHLYDHGKIPGKSVVDAIKIYDELANGGNARALYLMGLLYITGKGVEQNLTRATHYFQFAADKGYKRAQEKLAYLGITKQETIKNYNPRDQLTKSLALMKSNASTEEVKMERKIALKFLKSQAVQGVATAQYMLGCIFQNGWGVDINREGAINYFYLAAAQGHEQALTSLGERIWPNELENQASNRAKRARVELAHRRNWRERDFFAEVTLLNTPFLSPKDIDEAENAIKSFIEELVEIDNVYVEMNSWAEGTLTPELTTVESYQELFKFIKNPSIEKLSQEVSASFEKFIRISKLFLEPGTCLTCLNNKDWYRNRTHVAAQVSINNTFYYCYNDSNLPAKTTPILIKKLTQLRDFFKEALVILHSAKNTKKLLKKIANYELLESSRPSSAFLKCYVTYLDKINTPTEGQKFLQDLKEYLRERRDQVEGHLSYAEHLNEDFSMLINKTTDYRNVLFVKYIGLR